MRCPRTLLGLLLLLAASCSGSDEMPPDADATDTSDGSGDTSVDAGDDTSVDATRDTAADGTVDAPEDVANDAPVDAAPDVVADATSDVAADATSDVTADTLPDATPDVAVDVVSDITGDAGVDATDAVGDAGSSASVLFADGATVDGALFAITGVALNDALADRGSLADVTGDGQGDVLIGATESDSDRGQVAFFAMPIAGDLTLAESDVEIDGPDFYSGVGGMAVGDFDGDGNPDLAVGAWRIETVWVWLGPHDGTVALPTLDNVDIVLSGPAGAFTGSRLHAVNLDDDVDDELVVMMDSYGTNGNGAIAIAGFGGPLVTADLEGTATIYTAEAAFSNYGADVAHGDFNGDGNTDLVVGSDQDTPEPNGGGAHLIAGPIVPNTEPTLFADVTSQNIVGGVGQRKMCRRVDAIPSMNGNASDEVVCETTGGTVYVFDFALVDGDGTHMDAILTVVADPGVGNEAGAGGGDIDGDGVGDLVVGSPGTNRNSGALLVFLGATGHAGDVALDAADGRVDGTPAFRLGTMVEVGDITGDGFDDVLVSGPAAGTGGTVWGFEGGPDR